MAGTVWLTVPARKRSEKPLSLNSFEIGVNKEMPEAGREGTKIAQVRSGRSEKGVRSLE